MRIWYLVASEQKGEQQPSSKSEYGSNHKPKRCHFVNVCFRKCSNHGIPPNADTKEYFRWLCLSRILPLHRRTNRAALPAFVLFGAVLLCFALVHHPNKPLHHSGILMGEKCAFPFVQRRNCAHIFARQRKVKHLEILFHALLVNGLWDDDHTSLDMPAQHDLCGCFAGARPT